MREAVKYTRGDTLAVAPSNAQPPRNLKGANIIFNSGNELLFIMLRSLHAPSLRLRRLSAD